ncbi:MAG: ADP-forming succinate--CoA ligase subunit beta [Methanobrevibacter sp.]|jgi:succinyl-CoA synthetase beta subunit|nr:ADP-forming succinate--CoA ligase subunit beta [Candidatus Methanovirga basalitermitum]
MKFYEYDAKKLFAKEGIPILEGHVVYSPEQAMEFASDMRSPVAIKSQVLVGGRGKAGGIKFADNPGEAYSIASALFGMNIKGEAVKHLLIEKKANIKKEIFMAISIDRIAKKPVIITSSEGGMDIEELAKTNPEKLNKFYVNPLEEFLPYEAREIGRKIGIGNELISSFGSIVWKLFKIFSKYDAYIAEINPLVLTEDGLIAADAKLEVENDSLFRHEDLVQLIEFKPKEFAFVKLEGDIGVVGNGAGLTLTGMDVIKYYGGNPATFLDIGGGASENTIEKALNMVLHYAPVKVIFLNILGGITRADDVARGVIDILKTSERKPKMVIRITGTNEKEGQRLLDEAGIPYETSMEKAAQRAVELSKSLRNN